MFTQNTSLFKNHNLLIFLVFISLVTPLNCLAAISEVNLQEHKAKFRANHKSGLVAKLFTKDEMTHTELIISPALRRTQIAKINSNVETELTKLKELYGDGTEEYEDAAFEGKLDLVSSPEWDYQSNLTKVLILKNPSSFFSSGKKLKPVKYGLANSDDQVVCEPENAGSYELSDEDIEYLAQVYDIEVDKKNRHAYVAYYQALCMIDENISKRLIAFDEGINRLITILKYNRDAYNAVLRNDYQWLDKN